MTGVAEGLPEVKPPHPVNGMQIDSGETEILRKAVEDYFCFCYGKAHFRDSFSEQSTLEVGGGAVLEIILSA